MGRQRVFSSGLQGWEERTLDTQLKPVKYELSQPQCLVGKEAAPTMSNPLAIQLPSLAPRPLHHTASQGSGLLCNGLLIIVDRRSWHPAHPCTVIRNRKNCGCHARTLILLASVGLLWVLASMPALAQRLSAPPNREAAQYSFAPIVKKAAPAVVNVYVRARVQTFVSPFADDPLFRRFFGEAFGMPQERFQNSLGSGVIVSPAGTVVTNNHVIKIGGAAEIKVALADRREFDATVILQDEKSDIAVLHIEGGDGHFPFLEFENSDTIEVGDQVLAIGNPFGVGPTVTSGIISALERTEMAQSTEQVYIKTESKYHQVSN
jgi:hypothetical protein